MRHVTGYLIACAAAAVLPLVAPARRVEAPAFPGWPAELGGHALVEVPLLPEDEPFARDIGGHFARFDAGPHHAILRWLPRPTPRLHSIRDCFEGRGYLVREESESADGEWRVLLAERDGETLRIRERVEDATGRIFADVTAAYWHATPPLLATALVERRPTVSGSIRRRIDPDTVRQRIDPDTIVRRQER